MPSIAYKITERLFRHTVRAVMSGGSKEEFLDYVYSMASRRKLEVPSKELERRFDYSEVEQDELTVIKLAPKGRAPEGLTLYMTGDGLYEPPSSADFSLCADIVENTGRSVWLVSYPLITSEKPERIMEIEYDVYREALKEYSAENISLMGLSSGGALCLGICFYIKQKETGDPYPESLILQSVPLGSPPLEEQILAMSRISEKDVTSSLEYFIYLAAIAPYMGCEYLIRPMKHDMRGFPPIDIFYGTNEMAYAYLEDFEKKCGDEEVPLRVHIGEDMMKCWCLLKKTPEAGEIREEYYKILSGKPAL